MKKSLLLLLALISPFIGRQANANAECKAISKAETILQDVQTKYRAISTMRAEFMQRSMLAAVDSQEESAGVVYFKKPGAMRWEYKMPEEQLFIVSDEQVWFYQPKDKQVVHDSLKGVVLSDLPVAFLLGVGDLGRDFTIRGACQEDKKAGPIRLELAPKNVDAAKKLKSFVLFVDPTTKLPAGAIVQDAGGNETTILLSGIQANAQELPSSLFSPEFPEGTDIQERNAL